MSLWGVYSMPARESQPTGCFLCARLTGPADAYAAALKLAGGPATALGVLAPSPESHPSHTVLFPSTLEGVGQLLPHMLGHSRVGESRWCSVWWTLGPRSPGT